MLKARRPSTNTNPICLVGAKALVRKATKPQAKPKLAKVSVAWGMRAIPPFNTCLPSDWAMTVSTRGSMKRINCA